MGSIEKLVNEILNSILPPAVEAGIKSFRDKIRKRCLIKKITVLVRAYINDRDGTILTTGAFERYLNYYHPIEKILALTEATDETVKSKEKFIEDQVHVFFENCVEKEQNAPDNRRAFEDFLSQFYDIIFAYYRSSLTKNEKFLLSSVRSDYKEIMEKTDKNTETLGKDINEIKSMIQNQKSIDDPETVRNIYYNIVEYIWAGKGKNVEFLIPLIKGKNKDIELCIEFLLCFMKDSATKEQFEALQKNVSDNELCRDVVRKVIYLSFMITQNEMISAVGKRFNELFLIAQCILNEQYDSLFTVSSEESEGITYYTYEISRNNYPEEKWLISRICFLIIFETNTVNILDAVELIGEIDGILDKVAIYKKKTQIIASGIYSSEEANSVYAELYNEIQGEVLFPKGIQCMLYSTLLKLSFLVADGEPTQIAQNLPEDILSEDVIKMLLLQIKVISGEADCEEILKISRKTGEYWLLSNYLNSIVDNHPEKVAKIVEENRYILSDDVGIFIIYAQISERYYGVDKSLILFEEYESKHGGLLDFWVIKLILQLRSGISIDSELKEIFAKCQEYTVHSLSINLELDFIDILLQHNYFDETLEYIKRREKFVGEKLAYLRRKAVALLGKKREIEALETYLMLFSNGDCSDNVIERIIVLSINNNREVSNEVLEKIKNTTKSRMLMLLAICYERMGHEGDAKTFLLKSLFSNHGENDEVFKKYIAFDYRKERLSESKIELVDVDTYVVLQSNKNKSVKNICVHKQRILPTDMYEWEDATHIYKEDSIRLGIFRKRVGDTVNLEGEEYSIIELSAVDTFLFRTCMGKLIESGEMKAVTVPADEEGNHDSKELVDRFVDLIGDDKDRDWLKGYKDLSSIPATLYTYKRFVRATYTQLISAVLDDSNVIFRESLIDTNPSDSRFVLTSSALVALYKIETQPTFSDIEVFIPNSLFRTVCDETEEAIQNNNRETVAGMGVYNGQLYLIESSEEKKQYAMSEAVNLKEFCTKFNTIENHSDLQINIADGFDLKEILGISDYDALLIAKQNSFTLVVPEPIIAALGTLDEINVKTIGILDFLMRQKMDALILLSYVKRMLQYKFQAPINSNLIYYILDAYNESDPAEKEKILDSWDEIMEIAISDKDYKTWLSELFSAICVKEIEAMAKYNPIWLSFMFCTMRCKGLTLECYVDESGKLAHRIVEDEDIV